MCVCVCAIAMARLAQRCPDKKILAIEYGGPVQASHGGATGEFAAMEMTATAFQSAGASTKQLKPKQRLKRKEHDPEEPLCMLDVPGNYNNVAFRPAYLDKYNMTEFPGPWQGVGLGGNGCYNGALYQEPADWWWNDKVHNDIFVTEAEKAKGHNSTYEVMLPYFKKVRDAMDNGIHSRPSTDGVHYNHGLYDLLSPFLKAANFTEVPEDVLDLTAADERFFTVPAVCAKDGVRTGPRAWIDMVLDEDGLVRKEFPNLTLKCFTKVDTVLLDKSNEVTGVSVISPSGAKRGTLSNRLEAQKSYTINVNKGGKVIMCCGSLPTARVLYKSGLGCEGKYKNLVLYYCELMTLIITSYSPAMNNLCILISMND